MKTTQLAIATLSVALLAAGVALAQDTKMDPSKAQGSGSGAGSGSGSGSGSAAEMTPAMKAFKEANDKMHMGMMVQMTGDPDVDFIKGMMPHHQGAIDMANVQLQYGKDPDARKLAEDIIKAQNTEIAFMKEWLAKKGK